VETVNGNSSNKPPLKASAAVTVEKRQFVDGLSTKRLGRALFQGDITNQELRALPAQSLYMGIQSLGLESAGDVLAEITAKQYSRLLDFELWNKDLFLEDKFWNWLSIIDNRSDLQPLQRFIQCLPRTLLALIVSRNVTTAISEEPTAEPPGPNYFTPDRGYTWVSINIENETNYFLLGKLLASIFDGQPEFFYQLLATAGESTSIELEEESYQERRSNLLIEGIPDHPTAAKVCSPITPELYLAELNSSPWKGIGNSIVSVEPVVYDGGLGKSLAKLLEDVARERGDEGVDELKGELTLIANAALVFYDANFSEAKGVEQILEGIKDAIESGLNAAAEASKLSLFELHYRAGLVPVFRLGLKMKGHLQPLLLESSSKNETDAGDE